LLAHAVQLLQLLLLDALHRHDAKLRAARRFEQCRGVGRVGLVASHVGAHVLRRQQAYLVTWACNARLQ